MAERSLKKLTFCNTGKSITQAINNSRKNSNSIKEIINNFTNCFSVVEENI